MSRQERRDVCGKSGFAAAGIRGYGVCRRASGRHTRGDGVGGGMGGRGCGCGMRRCGIGMRWRRLVGNGLGWPRVLGCVVGQRSGQGSSVLCNSA